MKTRSVLRLLPIALTALVAFPDDPNCAMGAEEAVQGDRAKPPLSYPEEFREAPEVFEKIGKQPLVADQAIEKAVLLSAYDVASAPFKHRESDAAEVAGAHAPKALEGNSKSIMLWGPYAELGEGHYLVVYRFKLADEPTGNIFLDVCYKGCTRSGVTLDAAKQVIGEWLEIAVPVYLPEAKKLEFRFWPSGNHCTVDRVYVFKVTPKADLKKVAEAEELPEGKPVDGRTDVVRSPYTKNSGMIEISGLAKGAKVLCPYTGKFFQVP